MAGVGMGQICTSPYSYPVNARIFHQNRDRFGQYLWGQVIYQRRIQDGLGCTLS